MDRREHSLPEGTSVHRDVGEMNVQTDHFKIKQRWLEGVLVSAISLEGNSVASILL